MKILSRLTLTVFFIGFPIFSFSQLTADIRKQNDQKIYLTNVLSVFGSSASSFYGSEKRCKGTTMRFFVRDVQEVNNYSSSTYKDECGNSNTTKINVKMNSGSSYTVETGYVRIVGYDGNNVKHVIPIKDIKKIRFNTANTNVQSSSQTTEPKLEEVLINEAINLLFNK